MIIDFRPDLRARRGKLHSGGPGGTPVHAGAFLKERRVTLDDALLEDAPELLRILSHELFHFVWRRLDNATRLSWEALLKAELDAKLPGDLGWSAELRREKLTATDRRRRTPAWRQFCCEAFCDTAAWIFSPGQRHSEVTLAARARRQRRAWFVHLMKQRRLPL